MTSPAVLAAGDDLAQVARAAQEALERLEDDGEAWALVHDLDGVLDAWEASTSTLRGS